MYRVKHTKILSQDFVFLLGEPSRYPPVGYSDRGPPPALDRETDRLREPTELGALNIKVCLTGCTRP